MRFTVEYARYYYNKHVRREYRKRKKGRASHVCTRTVKQLSRREEERKRERRSFATRMRGDAHTCWHCDRACSAGQSRFFDWLPNPVKPTAERQLCGCLDHSFSEALRGRSTVLQQECHGLEDFTLRILHRTCFVTIFLAKGKYIRILSRRLIRVYIYIYICLLIHQHHPRFSRGWKVKCFLLDNSCDLKCKKKYVSRMLYGSGEMLGQFLSLSF